MLGNLNRISESKNICLLFSVFRGYTRIEIRAGIIGRIFYYFNRNTRHVSNVDTIAFRRNPASKFIQESNRFSKKLKLKLKSKYLRLTFPH